MPTCIYTVFQASSVTFKIKNFNASFFYSTNRTFTFCCTIIPLNVYISNKRTTVNGKPVTISETKHNRLLLAWSKLGSWPLRSPGLTPTQLYGTSKGPQSCENLDSVIFIIIIREIAFEMISITVPNLGTTYMETAIKRKHLISCVRLFQRKYCSAIF